MREYKIEGGLQTSYTSVTVSSSPSIVEVKKMLQEAGFQIFPKNEGFETITKKEYDRLIAKKSWWVKFFVDESPRAIWTIIVTAIITLCSFGYSWYKESKKTELEK